MIRLVHIWTLTALSLLPALCALAQSSAQPARGAPSFLSGPSTSGASLNGHPLLGGTTVLPNEQIVTGPAGSAVLARDQGGMVTLGHSSSATAREAAEHDSSLFLHTGLAAVYGIAPVETPQGRLRPGSPDTCYEVIAEPGKTWVLGISGTTQAQGQGGRGITVRANQAYVLQLNSAGQLVATPVDAGTVRSMAQRLQADTTTKVQTASPVK